MGAGWAVDATTPGGAGSSGSTLQVGILLPGYVPVILYGCCRF